MVPTLLVVLAVLALLVTSGRAVERLLEARAPRVAADRLGALLGLPVEVVAAGRARDWLRHRRIPVVAVTARDVPVRGGAAHLDRLDVQLRGVRLTGPRDRRRVVADGGDFQARLSQGQLRLLVDLPPLVRRLDVTDDHVRFVTTGGLVVDARLSAEEHGIVLTPVANPLAKVLPVRLRIPLDDLPAGARVERAVVRDGTVVASGPIDGSRLHGPTAA